MNTSKQPSFLIIGAMKSATTTLYDQLVAQQGIFMPALKEPNYFSDDTEYSKGESWYNSLFDAARENDILGEASTHYTKLPDYPLTLSRMQQQLKNIRCIYVMRHPIDRLISQYIHEWSEGEITVDINKAIESYPRLIQYSMYSYQLKPFFDAYGKDSILPIFFENIISQPQEALQKVCSFIGFTQAVKWSANVGSTNVSKDRIRKFPLYNLLVESKPAEFVRRNFVPRILREKIKSRFQMRNKPVLSDITYQKLKIIFDKDLEELGVLLGIQLNCSNFKNQVQDLNLNWTKDEH